MIAERTLAHAAHAWGAQSVPFSDQPKAELFRTVSLDRATALLNQSAALRATHLDSEAQLYSIERMDGRKFDWIGKQLGLSKVELARQLGVSLQSLYRCIWDGPPRLVALAILGLWYQAAWGDC
jgi:DNA-binding transcriptional regulator YiaG